MLEPETDNKMQTFLSGPFCSHTMPTIAVAAFCACIFMPAAQAVAMVPSPRQHLILSSGWRFLQQDVEKAQEPGFDDTEWATASHKLDLSERNRLHP